MWSLSFLFSKRFSHKVKSLLHQLDCWLMAGLYSKFQVVEKICWTSSMLLSFKLFYPTFVKVFFKFCCRFEQAKQSWTLSGDDIHTRISDIWIRSNSNWYSFTNLAKIVNIRLDEYEYGSNDTNHGCFIISSLPIVCLLNFMLNWLNLYKGHLWK